MFVNPQCRIQLVPGSKPRKGESWYCDILAVSFRDSTAYLCEVTLSRSIAALDKRLREWNENWSAIRDALSRDNAIPESWAVRPWVFVPEAQTELVSSKVARFLDSTVGSERMPAPRITSLESVTPWQYETPRQSPSLGDALGS
jgi:hypothetical protein